MQTEAAPGMATQLPPLAGSFWIGASPTKAGLCLKLMDGNAWTLSRSGPISEDSGVQVLW